MIWSLAHRYHPQAVLVADRHYSRQKPGTPQFMPPGSAFCLYAERGGHEAVWGTSFPLAEHVRHEWAGAWVCSIFRNEGVARASDMIRQAVAATRWHYGEPPSSGMVTFVREDAVRGKRDPGHTFIIAGFRPVGRTKRDGLLALQMLPEKMPRAEAPRGAQVRMAV